MYDHVRAASAEEIRSRATDIIDHILVEAGAQPFGDLPKAKNASVRGCTVEVALDAIRAALPDVRIRLTAGIYGQLSDLQDQGTLTGEQVIVLEQAARHFDQGAYPDLKFAVTFA